jgi:hypothetical protein
VVSFTQPAALSPEERARPYPLDMKPGGPQSRSERYDNGNFVPLPRTKISTSINGKGKVVPVFNKLNITP